MVIQSQPAAKSIGEVETHFFTFGSMEKPMRLRSGETLGPVTLAYETYGELNSHADNAILVFHALTGSQHAAGFNRQVDGVGDLWNEECQTGWWDRFVGPGLALDTDRFFVVCANYLGGCYGSSGPTSMCAQTRKPYGRSFPRVRLADTVDSQVRLLDHLGIERLHAVIGNSTGGMASLSLATRCPQRVRKVIPAASGLVTTPLQRVHNYEQITAIQNDPDFQGGDYEAGKGPRRGLMLARMISHKSFVSLPDMAARAGGKIRESSPEGHWYGIEHPLESYMLHQGSKLPLRFDANAYLRILDAWQTFDLLGDAEVDDYLELFSRCREQRYLIFTIDSDACFYPEEQSRLVAELCAAGVETHHVTLHSDKGHDSFLLEPELYAAHLHHFLQESPE